MVGDQPGPAKLEKARNYNIKELSEDELLDLILTKSGKQPMYAQHNSKDLNIGTSESEGLVDVKIKIENSSPNKITKERNSNEILKKKSPLIKDSKNKPKLKKLGRKEKETDKNDIEIVDSGKESKETKEFNESVKKTKLESGPKISNTEESISKRNELASGSKLSEVIQIKLENKKPINRLSDENISWTEKYKPKSTNDIIGI